MKIPTSRPKVIHVVDSLEIGGLERLVHDLVAARGSDCTSVACLEAIGPFGESLQKQGVRVDLIATRGGVFATIWRIRRYLLRTQPDVLHCHNLSAILNGNLGAMLAGRIPTIMTKHGAMVPGKGLGSRLNRFLIQRTWVVAVSKEARAIMQAWMPSGSRPVRIINNGISTKAYERLPSKREARVQLGFLEDAFIVGIVARVSGKKGHILLLDVFARLIARIPNALLLIVGDGKGLPAVETRIQQLGLGKHVMLLGARGDVPVILAATDVYCLPSEMEGMPMTVLEAMAAGLPAVCSDVGGIPDLVEQGKTGLLVKVGSAEELESALLCLALDRRRAEDFGRQGREKLLRDFSLKHTLDEYEALYAEALTRRGITSHP